MQTSRKISALIDLLDLKADMCFISGRLIEATSMFEQLISKYEGWKCLETQTASICSISHTRMGSDF